MSLSKEQFYGTLYSKFIDSLSKSGITMPPAVMESFLVLLKDSLKSSLDETFDKFSKDFNIDEDQSRTD